MRLRDPEWWRYAWGFARRGPTELGYAYFRGRRRRRNRADDDPVISESDAFGLSGRYDLDEGTLAAEAALLARQESDPPDEIASIQWFLPRFSHVYYGGTHTILRLADHLRREHGVESRFCIYDGDPSDVRPHARAIAGAFPALAGAELSPARVDDRPAYEHLRPCDAAVATYWTSAYPLARFRRARAKFYFVQDFEPAFYPAGSASALAEQTWRLGYPGLVNTPGLADLYRSYGNRAVSFRPAVDRARYHPPAAPRPERPVRVFFYGRPSQARNAFGLGLATLAVLERRYGEAVELVSAGDRWNPGQYGVADRVANLGILPDLDAVAELYRTCHVGLVFMLTAHPSYQPWEFAASGMATVSNANPRTEWFLRHEENALLAPPMPTLMADAVGRLVEDPALRHRLSERALAEVSSVSWADELEGVWRAMTGRDGRLTREPELTPRPGR